MTAISITLLVLTLIAWAAVVANSATLNSSDPAGNALSSAYGVFLVLALWILLAILMVVAGLRGGMPGWAKPAAVLLVPGSCAATLVATNLMSGQPGLRWPLLLPVLAPFLILGYAAWCYFPGIRSAVSPVGAGALAWGTLAVLSLLPLPALASRNREAHVNQRRIDADGEAEAARQQQQRAEQEQAAFRNLPDTARLWDLMPFTWDGNILREQALERARSLPTRQADAEQMLADGHGFPLLEVQELNLSPTPSFCARATSLLVKHAEDWRTTVEQPPAYEARAEKIEQYLGAMGWLKASGCDLAPVIDATEATVKGYPGSPGRQLFLEALARLRVPA